MRRLSSEISRRQVVQGAGVLFCLGAVHTSIARSKFITREVFPGMHFRRGLDEDASAVNEDAIANIGFIVGTQCVAVIDPGGSLLDGKRLRARVREVTTLPIRFVIMTHMHPDHVFGAGAFQEDQPTFVGHARMPQAMAQRGEYYQRRLDDILGKGASGPLVAPTYTVAQSDILDLGGRKLVLTAHDIAHSDADLSVIDTVSATLLAGDLVFVRRIPSLEGNLKGWLHELAALMARPDIGHVVPGHGPVSVEWPIGAGATQHYLRVLQTETRAAVKKGIDLDVAVRTVGQSEKANWALFDDYNGHNVTQAFKEIEWE